MNPEWQDAIEHQMRYPRQIQDFSYISLLHFLLAGPQRSLLRMRAVLEVAMKCPA